MDATKMITRTTYLQALGLFTMAHRHRTKADEFQKELATLLGVDPHDSGHVSDAIYDDRRTFDEALKLEGFTVEGDTP
jgi:hypothetical protein